MYSVIIEFIDGDFQPLAHVKRLRFSKNILMLKQDLEPTKRIYTQLLRRIRLYEDGRETIINFNKERGVNQCRAGKK